MAAKAVHALRMRYGNLMVLCCNREVEEGATKIAVISQEEFVKKLVGDTTIHGDLNCCEMCSNSELVRNLLK